MVVIAVSEKTVNLLRLIKYLKLQKTYDEIIFSLLSGEANFSEKELEEGVKRAFICKRLRKPLLEIIEKKFNETKSPALEKLLQKVRILYEDSSAIQG
ncbi:MAG: hypothetical protein DRO11_05890 [Methanobacteriota archaeon]|nr:MAG: hypothetical protein DRO11_05890 [Euryarchaeota archaeon]